ncbi:site-2 protease family protein [Candidatus Kuenenbacteria bacterium HGW-Kuenenbacteria-1]|uniref:Site-2 protease family protein n=1 Tax=Candidatus Kuenenbacteria bacterium HGW-Kuenenbacteria-1 TaxID=2013812 RepID=A0A2N1UMY5_9BACT|nr:MAG: site-2 protease family protein [Candidatus Kuenenbacteria bacterium HGW-Kuenenbacteria-1]
MFFEYLSTQPLFAIVTLLGIIYALTVHEFSHAFTTTLLGDDTAKNSGRLTLNPLAHLDFIGFLMLLSIGFGWGKPVPYNPNNLKNQKWGPAIVAFAGPLSNIISFFIFIGIFKYLIPFLKFTPSDLLVYFLSYLIIINIILAIFNLIPIPPLDGSKILFAVLPDQFENFKISLEQNGPYILIGLLVLDNLFNIGIFSSLFNWVIGLIGLI